MYLIVSITKNSKTTVTFQKVKLSGSWVIDQNMGILNLVHFWSWLQNLFTQRNQTEMFEFLGTIQIKPIPFDLDML